MTDERQPRAEDWRPNPGPQERFLSLTCFEALFGGAAGGGKSDAILIDAIRYVGRGHGPAYQALLLRRTFPDLEKSLIARSHALYPRIGGKYNEQKKAWTFPLGERVLFGYLEHEKDVFQYQGAAFPFIGFDELTHFSRAQYTYLISRCRSAHGVRCRMRGTTNPGGEGHAWVFERWGYWLDPEAPHKAGPGEVLYFHKGRIGEDIVVARDLRDEDGNLPLGRTFVPAKLADNPFLAADGQYARALRELDPVTQAQLRDGNWLIRPSKGLYFKRGWFPILDVLPPGGAAVRAWDLAATVPTKDNPDPDWTVGVKLYAYEDGTVVVADVARTRGSPGEVEAFVKATAQLDGPDVAIRLPQDPGQAGKSQVAAYAKLLAGFAFSAAPVTGDKIVRAGPVSAQGLAGNVRLLRGPWNGEFIHELEQFPEGAHDDQVDALADAYNRRAAPRPKRRPALHTSDFDSAPMG